jgi:hypothetical protein
MLTWLQASYRVGKATALALASPVLDLRITQVANQVLGRSCAASGGRDQLTGGVVRCGTASAPTATVPSGPQIRRVDVARLDVLAELSGQLGHSRDGPGHRVEVV